MFRQTNAERIYEGDIHYENNQARIVHGAPATPPRNDQKRQQTDINTHVDDLKTQINDVGGFMKKTTKQNTIGFAIAQAVIISILVTLVVLFYNNGTQTTSAHESFDTHSLTNDKSQHAKSCYDLKKKQLHTNGIYPIKPEENHFQIEVFCDMETDGGGWTLVASIHENNIAKKCDINDRWSEYVPIEHVDAEVKTSWENKRIFGDVRQCALSDYKNSAYYAMIANDIMIWHVPSQTSTIAMKSRAKLRYRTTNHFLQNVGGNLKSLFDERYPLKVKFEKSISEKRNDLTMSALVKVTATIRGILSDYYSYSYGTHPYSLSDTTLYHYSGNYIQFETSIERRDYLYYDQRIKFIRPAFVIDMRRSQPFLLVATISNKDKASQFFEIKTQQNVRPDSIDKIKNNVTREDLLLQYHIVQFSNSDDPTLCEFHFIICNMKTWRSNPPTSFVQSYQHVNGRAHYNRFRANGNPSNVVMGYMLLTRSAGNKVTATQADKIASVILEAISTLKELFNEKDIGEGLVVPVTFDKGSADAVLETIPPNLRQNVEPGYIEFRAYNDTGYPNAMCPGIKLNTNAAEYGCIGGISDDVTYSGTCGDFAGWAGEMTDVIQQNEASGLAHSQNDISSAILIFYR